MIMNNKGDENMSRVFGHQGGRSFTEAQTVSGEGIMAVESKYSLDGIVFPDREPHPHAQALPYHNGQHTNMVVRDLIKVGDALGLTPDEINTGICAASFHDVEQNIKTPGANEVESAKMCVESMTRSSGFSRVMIEMANLAILGTAIRFEEGTIVQHAVEQCYPTKRHELLAHAVAGADVGRLFSGLGPLQAHKLFLELMQKANNHPTLEDLKVFQNSQITFLEGYRYPNRDIETALVTQRPKVIKYLIELSSDMNSGRIETFADVLVLDLQFAEQVRGCI